MKILFETNGSLLVIYKSITIDTNKLSVEEAGRLRRLIESIGKRKLKSLPKHGAGYIIYSIKVEDIDIEVTDLTMSESVRELIDTLMLNKKSFL